jgi:hypothetical protein
MLSKMIAYLNRFVKRDLLDGNARGCARTECTSAQCPRLAASQNGCRRALSCGFRRSNASSANRIWPTWRHRIASYRLRRSRGSAQVDRIPHKPQRERITRVALIGLDKDSSEGRSSPLSRGYYRRWIDRPKSSKLRRMTFTLALARASLSAEKTGGSKRFVSSVKTKPIPR